VAGNDSAWDGSYETAVVCVCVCVRACVCACVCVCVCVDNVVFAYDTAGQPHPHTHTHPHTRTMQVLRPRSLYAGRKHTPAGASEDILPQGNTLLGEHIISPVGDSPHTGDRPQEQDLRGRNSVKSASTSAL
jgi:hypothetical protein